MGKLGIAPATPRGGGASVAGTPRQPPVPETKRSAHTVVAPVPMVHIPASLPSDLKGLLEVRENLSEKCAHLEVSNARHLDEIATLRSRAEVELPHWAQELYLVGKHLEELAEPFASAPLGDKLQEVISGLRDAEAGLRGVDASGVREELAAFRQVSAVQF